MAQSAAGFPLLSACPDSTVSMGSCSNSGSCEGVSTTELVVSDGFRLLNCVFFDSGFGSRRGADQIDVTEDDTQFIKVVANRTLMHGSRQ